MQINGDIKNVDEATKTAEATAMQTKIAEAYRKIQAESAKAMAVDTTTSSRYAIGEAEHTKLRLHQVESSVLKIHELCHHMASKVGVDASAVENFKPKFVPGHNQDCL